MQNLKGHLVLIGVAALGVALIVGAMLLPPGNPPLPPEDGTQGPAVPTAEPGDPIEPDTAAQPATGGERASIEPMDEPAHVRLMRAASAGDIETIDSLVAMGVAPDTAASTADVEAVASPPLEAGATALVLAARDADAATVDALLDAGADPNAQTDSGLSPLMLAAQRGQTEAVVSLLGAGADPTLSSVEGRTALMLAARAGADRAVALLLEAGADPEATDADGVTALMHAAGGQHMNAVLVLLGGGARVDAVDRNGRGALDRAGEQGPIADVLREAAGG